MKIKFYKEAKIGLIVTLAIVILIWGMSFLKGNNILKRKYIYYAIYERIEGLEETAPVLINGYKVGLVNKVYIDKADINHITIELAIKREIEIPRNSIAIIFSSDLMGTKAVKILLTDSLSRHEYGDTLISKVEADLTEQVSIQMLPLKKQAEDLMQEMQEALEVIKYVFNESTRDNLSKSFESIKMTIYNLEKTSYTLDTLMQGERTKLSNIFSNIESITQNINKNNTAITQAIQNISNISDSIAKANLLTTLHSIENSLLQISEITEKINVGEGSIGQLVNNDTLYYNIESATKNLDALIDDIKLNPKKYVHFSVIDMGKTVYELDEEKIKLKNRKSK
ncbi:MlaD family protein [Bacteroidota bacterium]